MPIEVVFGREQSELDPARGEIRLANPLFGGAGRETLLGGDFQLLEQREGHFIAESGDWLAAAFCAPVAGSMGELTQHIYDEIFRQLDGCPPVRVWNFVPAINEKVDGLENYRAFCQGRHEAFYRYFGSNAAESFCAASGVGIGGDRLVVIALATTLGVHHLENPLQSPAYHYPKEYGPRPPSFCRASLVSSQPPAIYISGTSAVRGHESIGQGDLSEQLVVTGENLDRIVAESVANLGDDISRLGPALARAYVRRPEDADLVMDCILNHAWCREDRVNVIQADICRSELLVEIELSWPGALA